MGRALETDRLLLRPFRPEDRADCFGFLSDPETCHLDGGYEPFREMDRDYDALMEKLAGQEGRYMVEERASCRVVGTVHIFKDALRRVPAMEIGYVISPACRRRGYAAEAVERVIRYLFEETDTVLVTAGAAAGMMAPHSSKQAMKTQVGQGIHKLGVAVDQAVDNLASEMR